MWALENLCKAVGKLKCNTWIEFQNVLSDRLPQSCLQGFLDCGQEGLELGHRPTSMSIAGIKVGKPLTWSMVPPRSFDILCWWQDQGQIRLWLSSQGCQATSGSIAGNTVTESANWAEPAFSKWPSLVLDSTAVSVFYLDHKAPTNALLSMDNFHITVAEEGYEQEIFYSAILLTSPYL